MERGGREEEAGSPPGECVKPHELIKQNMDSKTFSYSIYSNQTHPLGFGFSDSECAFLIHKVTLLLIIFLSC